MRSRLVKVIATGCVFVACAALAFSAMRMVSGAPKALEVGAAMPDFALTDLNGVKHTLAQYKGKTVVLDFCSHKCPWSAAADVQMVELAKKYGEKGVVFLGIDSHESTPPEEIKAHVTAKGIPYPILKDQNNAYADAVGASRTPEIYIVDKDLKLAYHGAFDNRTQPEPKGDTNYVSNALDDLLGGKAVRTPSMKAWGCSIKRAK